MIDQCLGCVACETSCPSKVKYGDLISPFRVTIEPNRRRSVMDRMKRLIISQTLPYPWRFRAALKAAGLGRMFRPLLFRALQPMLDLIPPELPARGQTPGSLQDPRNATGTRGSSGGLCATGLGSPNQSGDDRRIVGQSRGSARAQVAVLLWSLGLAYWRCQIGRPSWGPKPKGLSHQRGRHRYQRRRLRIGIAGL